MIHRWGFLPWDGFAAGVITGAGDTAVAPWGDTGKKQGKCVNYRLHLKALRSIEKRNAGKGWGA